MNTATSAAFLQISRCPNVRACIETSEPHPCRRIVEAQGVHSYEAFQLPEPWVGEIDVAPILFVSSNPSIGDDTHAVGRSSNEDVWESHHLAFGGGRRTYIRDGIRTVSPEGQPLKSVPYWSGARARARELITTRVVVPGRDYAMTEIVHCKSRSEYGVPEAASTCANMHMERVMNVAAATLIISVGAFARKWFLKGADIPESPQEVMLGGRSRLLAFIPHFSPGPGGPRILSKRYTLEDMKRMRTAVAS